MAVYYHPNQATSASVPYTVTTSGGYGSDYPAWKAFDAYDTTSWWADVAGTSIKWVAVDYKESRFADRVRLSQVGTTSPPPYLDVKVSDNGTSWRSVGTFPQIVYEDNKAVLLLDTPTTSRYWRYEFKASSSGHRSRAANIELGYAISPCLFKNNDTDRFFSIANNQAFEVADGSYETAELYGVPDTEIINVDNVEYFQDLIGSNFSIIKHSDAKTSDVSIIEDYLGVKTAESDSISLVGLDSITSVAIVSTGNTLTSFSFDGGITWLKYTGDAWVQVTSEEDGLTTAEVNALTEAAYMLGMSGKSSMKLRHALHQGDTITSVNVRVNKTGTYAPAANTSYRMTYTNGTITYTALKAGKYQINYVDAN